MYFVEVFDQVWKIDIVFHCNNYVVYRKMLHVTEGYNRYKYKLL